MMSLVVAAAVVSLFCGAANSLELTGRYENEGVFVFYDIKNVLTLKCSSNEATDIAWYKNETKVGDVGFLKDRYEISTGDGKKESTFKVLKALQGDAGEYSCRAKGVKQSFQAAGNVAVKLPSNYAIIEGEKLRLHCNAVGAAVSITWYLPDNSTIDEDGDHDDER